MDNSYPYLAAEKKFPWNRLLTFLVVLLAAALVARFAYGGVPNRRAPVPPKEVKAVNTLPGGLTHQELTKRVLANVHYIWDERGACYSFYYTETTKGTSDFRVGYSGNDAAQQAIPIPVDRSLCGH